MTFFAWKEDYSVGIEEIDAQHKELVAILNELYDAMYAGQGRDALGSVLARLIGYARVHFAKEEELMARHGYPDYQAHKDKHEKMTRKVLELKKNFDAGVISSPVQISNFLKNWLSKHIMGTDRKYGPFLRAKGLR
jgi:hemerythrin